MARKLLLVPVLVIALFTAVLDASAGNRNGGDGVQASPGSTSTGYTNYRPAGVGDGRRIK